ncbi:FAD-dependent oxidoreductase [Streptomyces sporangiiformans]|uniref:FAD-dependent oxidoreductase n=1 Tax=Streptomyces sporangiiformans TaxID=2315329 RepID=A0A505D4L4_9ACTN|nr:FAD-dependent oxidoreductase [Streptomyces sporangiiformans]TPQ18604.1 FAD-dependent oxidoreductase [Streptomyces sporangiiformans]
MTAPAVVVVGGSVAGLATALALAERGFAVRVLERSAPPPEGPVEKAAELWHRPTVAHSGHSHILNSLGVRVLRRSAPRLLDTALEEGARLLDLTWAAPTRADRELVALAVRRPVLELLLHRAVSALPTVTIDHSAAVRGLLLDPSGSQARGVLTDSGAQVPARFVVDATGRKAAARAWLRDAGTPVGEDLTDPTHLRCFTRFYRLTEPDGTLPGPLNRGNAAGGIWDHYAAVVHLADNGTFAIALGTLTSDPATTVLREPEAFTAAARLSPHVAEWTDERVATPLTGVRAITMPPNTLSSTIRPGQRQAAGLFPVGDAACVTDPLYGRGMSLALEHAFRLAELLDAHPTAGERQSDLAVHLADEIHRPWYEQAVHDSRARTALWRAKADGTPLSPVSPAAPGRPALAEVARAAVDDATVRRGLVRVLMGLDMPAKIFDDAGFRERVDGARDAVAPAGLQPPTRQELLAALGSEEE